MARPSKRAFLEAAGALHPHPERVRAGPFLSHRFFDSRDKVQVKYEMVRAHAIAREPIARVARAFGVSRETVYATSRRLATRGVPGLADGKRGRKGPVKITPAIRDFAVTAKQREPALAPQALAEQIATEFGVVVHKKTVERLLAAGAGKKNGHGRWPPTPPHETGLSSDSAAHSDTSRSFGLAKPEKTDEGALRNPALVPLSPSSKVVLRTLLRVPAPLHREGRPWNA